MPPIRYRGQPMTLANMRANSVRSLSVMCKLCHHEAMMNVDAFDDTTPVPAFGPRIVCTTCGIVGAFARPNWKERSSQESLTGVQWR
jgi:thymidine kinase